MIPELAFFWRAFMSPDIGKSMKLLKNGAVTRTAFRNLVLLCFEKSSI